MQGQDGHRAAWMDRAQLPVQWNAHIVFLLSLLLLTGDEGCGEALVDTVLLVALALSSLSSPAERF